MSEEERAYSELARRISRRRKELGMSQAALAERMREAGSAHWHQTTVSRVENGKQDVSLTEAGHLFGILGREAMADTELEARLLEVGTMTKSLLPAQLEDFVADLTSKLRKNASGLQARRLEGAARLSLDTAGLLYEHASERLDLSWLTTAEQQLDEALTTVRKLKDFADERSGDDGEHKATT